MLCTTLEKRLPTPFGLFPATGLAELQLMMKMCREVPRSFDTIRTFPFQVRTMSDSTAVAEPPVEEAPVEPRQKRRRRKQDRTKPKRQPPYAVIVHNDDYHTWPYVIEVLQRVCGHSEEKAYQLTSQIHYTGRAIVWSGALEVAELKRDQIRGFGTDFYASDPVKFPLGVTIEPLPGPE